MIGRRQKEKETVHPCGSATWGGASRGVRRQRKPKWTRDEEGTGKRKTSDELLKEKECGDSRDWTR